MEELILSSGMIGPIPDKPVSEDQVFLGMLNAILEISCSDSILFFIIYYVISIDLSL